LYSQEADALSQDICEELYSPECVYLILCTTAQPSSAADARYVSSACAWLGGARAAAPPASIPGQRTETGMIARVPA
jgi:hypothetical protein